MNPIDVQQPQILTPEDLERDWALPKNTQAKRRLNGDFIPFIKIGRAVRYRREDVEAWFKGRLQYSTSDQPKK